VNPTETKKSVNQSEENKNNEGSQWWPYLIPVPILLILGGIGYYLYTNFLTNNNADDTESYDTENPDKNQYVTGTNEFTPVNEANIEAKLKKMCIESISDAITFENIPKKQENEENPAEKENKCSNSNEFVSETHELTSVNDYKMEKEVNNLCKSDEFISQKISSENILPEVHEELKTDNEEKIDDKAKADEKEKADDEEKANDEEKTGYEDKAYNKEKAE
jgi:hypothetical protein